MFFDLIFFIAYLFSLLIFVLVFCLVAFYFVFLLLAFISLGDKMIRARMVNAANM